MAAGVSPRSSIRAGRCAHAHVQVHPLARARGHANQCRHLDVADSAGLSRELHARSRPMIYRDAQQRHHAHQRQAIGGCVHGAYHVHVHGHPQRCDGIADQYAIGRDSGGVGAVAVHHHPHSTERQHPLAGLVGMVPHHAERRVAVDTAG